MLNFLKKTKSYQKNLNVKPPLFHSYFKKFSSSFVLFISIFYKKKPAVKKMSNDDFLVALSASVTQFFEHYSPKDGEEKKRLDSYFKFLFTTHAYEFVEGPYYFHCSRTLTGFVYSIESQLRPEQLMLINNYFNDMYGCNYWECSDVTFIIPTKLNRYINEIKSRRWRLLVQDW